jgi:mRNA interferase MazF
MQEREKMVDREKLKVDKEKALRTWTEEKIQLSKEWIDNETIQKGRNMVRGAIHICTLGENIGSEQNEERPVLIISNDLMNSTGGNVTVIPLTSRLTKKNGTSIPKYRSHYFLMKSKYKFLTYDSAVKTEDITTVSKIRLGDYLGNIDADDIHKVSIRMKWVFNL